MTLKYKIVQIQKPRRCFSCGDRFEIGSLMVYNVGIWEGDFSTCYYCLCCDSYINNHMRGETWYEGDFRGEEHFENFKKEFYARNTNNTTSEITSGI